MQGIESAATNGATVLRLAEPESRRVEGLEAGEGAGGEGPARPDVTERSRGFNRDLSWLEFNRRVLALAQDERTPLLERLRFLAIFSSNLDEFVMKRLGLLQRRLKQGQDAPDQDGVPTPELLSALRSTIRVLQQKQHECFEQSVRPALRAAGIELTEYGGLTAAERRWLRLWYRKNVFPVLTPLAVDTGHRFPFISNLSQNFGVLLSEPEGSEARGLAGVGMATQGGAGGESGVVSHEPLFARVKIPSVLTQWIRLPEYGVGEGEKGGGGKAMPEPASARVDAAGARGGRFVPLRDVIQHNLDDLFPGMKILEVAPFRVTRDFETDPGGDDDDNLLERVEAELRKRRFANPVRLEVGPNPSPSIVGHLAEELELTPAAMDEREGLLDYTTLTELCELDRPDLKWPRWSAVSPARLERDADVFARIREGDVLVHHPFESFAESAERFIHDAARDPDVLAIKQTIYRTSRDSPFVSSLIRAAEAGKQVAVLVELRARFDEQANVRLARMLEKAGAHVAYGVLGYKTHCKAAMVVRREPDGLRTYAHLGTGNYHPRTAQLYTDLGLFTCDAPITEDVAEVFNVLTGRSRLDTFETLLVAPLNMKRRFIELIRREGEQARRRARGESAVGGRIIAKMNALADGEVAEALYEAASAGASVTLFVRGFCCLRPGVPGLSTNIRVVSVLGRFLEHSRVFHFGGGKADPLEGHWYISSADWMYRNLMNRVETACPVFSRGARAKLLRIIQVMAADRRGAWELMPDGSYARLRASADAAADSPEALGTFATLMREAQAGARR